MTDIPALLQRQAEWQKTRTALSWPEKVRMSEAIRPTILALRRVDRSPGFPPQSVRRTDTPPPSTRTS